MFTELTFSIGSEGFQTSIHIFGICRKPVSRVRHASDYAPR
jgi:hypothetical protein